MESIQQRTHAPESQTKAWTVCAIVVTYERLELLVECLKRLDSQTRRPDHILVVDNASQDGTGAFLRDREGIEALSLDENVGGAGGFEAGLRHAHGQRFHWYWLLDDDTFAEPECLEAMLVGAEEAPAVPALLTSVVRWKDGRLHPMNRPWPRSNRRVQLVQGAAVGLLAIRRATFVSTMIHASQVDRHGFPPGHYFIWLDDTSYTGRILRDGVGYIAVDSAVTHWTAEPQGTVSDSRGRFYYKVRNHLWALRSGSFQGAERFWWTLNLISAIRKYLTMSDDSIKALTIVARGLKDGLGPEPK